MCDIKSVWPKWKIVKTIGEGSFGKVFEILRNEYGIEEHSALKVISIPQSDNEVQSLKNDGMTDSDTTEYFKGIVNDFVQEIQLMTQLKGNSNIVAYEDFAVVEKTDSVGYEILIRMELLTGLPLYLRENHFRVFDVIQLGIDMCRALEVCRELNIVHRDIKPDNIFVSANGSFKLGDFGVARTIEKTMAGLSRKGTYSYMAPEIYNGKEYGFEADIYSLGIVLYKLLNNNRDPFLPPYPAPVKYSDKTEAMVKRIQGLELPKPANADEKLARIVFKACAHNPLERYQHPKELRFELESIALSYAELQNEVFSENGINYYTNNSIFATGSKGTAITMNGAAADEDKESVSIEDEGTMLLTEVPEDKAPILFIEPTEDEGTMLLIEPTEDKAPMPLADTAEDKAPIPLADTAEVKVPMPLADTAEDKAPIPLADTAEDKGPILFIEPTEDEGTMLLIEPTEDKAPVPLADAAEDKSILIAPNHVAEDDTFEDATPVKTETVIESKDCCPNCKNAVRPTDSFCGYCGHRLVPPVARYVVCPACGFTMQNGVVFCGKCGRKI